MSLLSYLAFLTFCIDLVLVVAALWFDPRAALNRWCAAHAFLFVLWALGEVFFFATDDLETLNVAYRISALGWTYIPPVILSLMFEIVGLPKKPRNRLLYALPFYVASTAMLIYVLTGGDFIQEVYSTPLGTVGTLSASAALTAFYAVFYAIILISSALLFYAQLKAKSNRLRRQTRVQLIVMVGTTIANGYINTALPPVWRYTAIPWVLTIAATLFLIVKYRFMRLDYPLVEQDIIRTMEEAVILVDPGFRIIKANPAALSLFVRPADELIGHELSAFVDQDDRLASRWQGVLETGQHQRVEECSIAGNHVSIDLTPTFNAFGDRIGGVVLIRMDSLLDLAALRFGITAREKEISLMLMQGYSNKDIADVCFISPGTVKTHVHKIYQKTGATNRVDLVKTFIDGACQ